MKTHPSSAVSPLDEQKREPRGRRGSQVNKLDTRRRRDLQERPLHTLLSPGAGLSPAVDFQPSKPLPREAGGSPGPGTEAGAAPWWGLRAAPALGAARPRSAPLGWAGPPRSPARCPVPGGGDEAALWPGYRALCALPPPGAARRRLMREPAQLVSAASAVPPRESRSR